MVPVPTPLHPLPERLDGEDLVLRIWRESDIPALTDLVARNIEHLRPWMSWVAAEPLSPTERGEQVVTWRSQWRDGADAIYGVFVDGEPVGGAGLHRRRGPSGLEIGYWVDQRHCGRGIATRAAGALTATALRHPGIMFVEIHHDKANHASARIPAKLGYAYLGERADEVRAPAEVGVDCAWRMSAASWSAGHSMRPTS